MTYACPAWELAADSHLLKVQRLQNRVLRTTGNLPRRTLTSAVHRAFQIQYVCDYIRKICKKQAEFLQTHDNLNARNIYKNEAQQRIYKRLKLGGGQAYDRSDI
jgi:hypothetical protein